MEDYVNDGFILAMRIMRDAKCRAWCFMQKTDCAHLFHRLLFFLCFTFQLITQCVLREITCSSVSEQILLKEFYLLHMCTAFIRKEKFAEKEEAVHCPYCDFQMFCKLRHFLKQLVRLGTFYVFD